jgi:hypothetical protein
MTNQPTQYDAVLGGNNQTTAAVLGGIEGARQRFHKAKEFRQRYAAWLEIAKYDSAEAERLSNQLIRLNINIDGAGVQKINDAIASVQQAAVNIASTIAPTFKIAIDAVHRQFAQTQISAINQNLYRLEVDLEKVTFASPQPSLEEMAQKLTGYAQTERLSADGYVSWRSNSFTVRDAQTEAERKREEELKKKHLAKFSQHSYLGGVERVIEKKRKRKY